MKSKLALSATIVAIALASGTAMGETLPKFSGGLLVDANGMTLYTFDKDAQGKSNCKGGCAAAWPPAAAADDDRISGELSIIERENGERQWAFKGAPLYRYAADAKAGDASGDNQGNVWHVVKTGRAAQAAPAGGYMSYGSY